MQVLSTVFGGEFLCLSLCRFVRKTSGAKKSKTVLLCVFVFNSALHNQKANAHALRLGYYTY